MSLSESTKSPNTSQLRDFLAIARYYLGNRRTLLLLAVVATGIGLALNWSWLVAIGLAPILLSTLPCLVMCAFGVCMMHRSSKEQSDVARKAIDKIPCGPTTSKNTLQDATICCHHSGDDAISQDGHQRLSDTTDSSRPDQRAGQRPS